MSSFDLFANIHRPDPNLIYKRDDPNDPRLGEIVKSDPSTFIDSQIVILGCPQDEGVRRNKGRPGAADAPDSIRQSFYRLSVSTLDLARIRLFDSGNTIIQDTLEATHDLHREIVRKILSDGKNLIVLGGGNDTSYPDCSALALETQNVLAFNIDAHFDVRADEPRNSGTPYRQLLEENHLQPERFFEMGYQLFGNSPVYLQYLAEKGVRAFSLDALRKKGIIETFKMILDHAGDSALFWGFDLDSVRAADAPGVSAPNPVGFSGDEFCQIAYLAGQHPGTRIVEFTEVNPTYDIDGRTCRLTAAAMFYYLMGYSAQKINESV